LAWLSKPGLNFRFIYTALRIAVGTSCMMSFAAVPLTQYRFLLCIQFSRVRWCMLDDTLLVELGSLLVVSVAFVILDCRMVLYCIYDNPCGRINKSKMCYMLLYMNKGY